MILAQESAESAERDGAPTDDPSPGSDDQSDANVEAGRHDPDAMHALAIDRAALQVLKEEAERELSLRRAQASKSDGRPAESVQPASGNAAPGRRPQASGRSISEPGRGGWVHAVLPLLLMMAALVGLLVAIYLRAPEISHTYPNTEGPLQSYLEAANAFLDWLNGMPDR
ncbi:MAG: hypothetical protein F4X97_04760 [Boseongicola sp. SB0662_bin_57]|nr:hypothetical protein [Boseongicola sp. SB0662_bin_57]